jgi:hypothetical protein
MSTDPQFVVTCSSAAVSLAALIIEGGIEVVLGDDIGSCACYRIYNLDKDELEFRTMYM